VFFVEIIVPDIDWYASLSSQKSIPTRCPYANADRCSRYYESLSLLGSAGITTALQPSEEKRLLKRWKNSEHWPKVNEHAVSISGPANGSKSFSHFCPEVAFDVFGLFASELHRYADEIDTDVAHKQLSKQGALASDWRWQWSNITPLHYSECRLYSLLGSIGSDRTKEIFEAKPGVAGFTVNIKEIAKRIWKWVCSRNKD